MKFIQEFFFFFENSFKTSSRNFSNNIATNISSSFVKNSFRDSIWVSCNSRANNYFWDFFMEISEKKILLKWIPQKKTSKRIPEESPGGILKSIYGEISGKNS